MQKKKKCKMHAVKWPTYCFCAQIRVIGKSHLIANNNETQKGSQFIDWFRFAGACLAKLGTLWLIGLGYWSSSVEQNLLVRLNLALHCWLDLVTGALQWSKTSRWIGFLYGAHRTELGSPVEQNHRWVNLFSLQDIYRCYSLPPT